MGDLATMARFLIFIGLGLAALGGLLLLAGQVFPLGRLPGDFLWQRGGFSLHFPLATSLILSLLLTIIANFLLRH